ncbi:hypothetical protein, partial [Escherichia coli]|uniref:hypothetical protein n=1 Tax=Escherichia coli TaxID=562 RepID=UPI001F44DCB3
KCSVILLMMRNASMEINMSIHRMGLLVPEARLISYALCMGSLLRVQQIILLGMGAHRALE